MSEIVMFVYLPLLHVFRILQDVQTFVYQAKSADARIWRGKVEMMVVVSPYR